MIRTMPPVYDAQLPRIFFSSQLCSSMAVLSALRSFWNKGTDDRSRLKWFFAMNAGISSNAQKYDLLKDILKCQCFGAG